MKHTRSDAEIEIRDALVAFLRSEIPRARIIHEMQVDGRRADVAAVTTDRVLLFEIKSERDTLTRAVWQMDCFKRASHRAALVMHEKFFDAGKHDNGRAKFAVPDSLKGYGWDVWCYPADASDEAHGLYRWRLPRPTLAQPPAQPFLHLLWKDELLRVAHAYRVGVTQRSRCEDIVNLLAWHMTGKEICHAVCGALRTRAFSEADAPVLCRENQP